MVHPRTPFVTVAPLSTSSSLYQTRADRYYGGSDLKTFFSEIVAMLPLDADSERHGVLYFTRGRYTVAETAGNTDAHMINLTSKIHIMGDGPGSTVFRFNAGRGAGADRYMIGTNVGTAYGTTLWSVSNLTIQCQDAQDHGMRVKGAARGRIENVQITHLDKATSIDEGIQFSSDDGDYVRDISLVRVVIENFGAAGIEFAANDVAGSCHTIHLEDVEITNCNDAIKTRNKPNDLYFTGGSLHDNTVDGFSIGDSKRLFIRDMTIYNNRIGINGNSSSATDIEIEGGTIRDNNRNAAYLGGARQSIRKTFIIGNGKDFSLADKDNRAALRFNGTDLLAEGVTIRNSTPAATSTDTNITGVETNGSAAIDDPDAIFTTTIRDGAHAIEVVDNNGNGLTGFIGTTDVDGDNTRVNIFNSTARTTQNWVGGGSQDFSFSATPITINVFAESGGAHSYLFRLQNSARVIARDINAEAAILRDHSLGTDTFITYGGVNKEL